MEKNSCLLVLIMLGSLLFFHQVYASDSPELNPLRTVVELNLQESKQITLNNGDVVELKLLEIDGVHDNHRGALRAATVRIAVNGEEVSLGVGNYHLPVTVGGVQIDCPVVAGYYKSTSRDAWKLKKDARLRLWPERSPYLEPGTFMYPIRQAWFAGMTQMGNEPPYVPRGEQIDMEVKYHSGLDISGAEGLTEIVSATDGLIISANSEVLEGYEKVFPERLEGEYVYPPGPRPDVAYVIDPRGWLIRYSHMDSIEPDIKPGATISMGQRIGLLGKKGASGGYAHLHFEVFSRQTASGEWGSEDAYAYAWEAYVREYNPSLLAVARPHRLARTGEPVILDGSRSRSLVGDINGYEWSFSGGSRARGAVQHRVYEEPGEYSEVLKVTDSEGNIDYDVTVVQVYEREHPERAIPTIHASFYPTLDLDAGEPVTFMVRLFTPEEGQAVWDFGDGTPPVTVQTEGITNENRIDGKYATTRHAFDRPGQYIVSIQGTDEDGITATTHLKVVVGE